MLQKLCTSKEKMVLIELLLSNGMLENRQEADLGLVAQSNEQDAHSVNSIIKSMNKMLVVKHARDALQIADAHLPALAGRKGRPLACWAAEQDGCGRVWHLGGEGCATACGAVR